VARLTSEASRESCGIARWFASMAYVLLLCALRRRRPGKKRMRHYSFSSRLKIGALVRINALEKSHSVGLPGGGELGTCSLLALGRGERSRVDRLTRGAASRAHYISSSSLHAQPLPRFHRPRVSGATLQTRPQNQEAVSSVAKIV
jgi:hypothetical protein